MKYSKTFQLIQSLNNKEYRLFKNQLKLSPKKLRLFNSFNKYIKDTKEPDIKEFYGIYYKEKYTKTKDNTLRNEFRLLNGLIETYIIQLEIDKELKINYYFNRKIYLKSLLDRNILALFEKEITKVFKRIDEKEDYFEFFTFFELWTIFQNNKFTYDFHYFSHANKFYKQGITKWYKEVSFKTKKLELFIAFIERTNLQIENDIEFSKSIDNIKLTKATDSNYIHFIEKKIESFKTLGESKIDILLETLAILKTVDTSNVNKANEEFSISQSIGVEYMIHGKNEKAVEFFKQVIVLKGKIEDNYFIKGLYNYILAEIKLKEYQKAIKLFIDYKKEVASSYIAELFNNAISMCYILIGDIDSAEKLTTIISSSISTENNIYSRCNTAILYYLNKNLELALNELINISQTINYHNYGSNNGHSDFLSEFKQFIHFSSMPNGLKENEHKLLKIKERIQTYIDNTNEKYSGATLHNLWLIEEISKVSILKIS